MSIPDFQFLSYFLSTPAPFEQLEKLTALVTRLAEHGYLLTDGYAVKFTQPENLITDPNTIAEVIENTCRAAPALRQLYFWQYPFEFSLMFYTAEESYWMLSTPNNTLIGALRDMGERNAAAFVKVVTLTLAAYPPDYGCAFGLLEHPPRLAPKTQPNVGEVYPMNYFGAEYATRLGQAHLLAAPAQVKGEMAGGILLVPSLRAIYADDQPSAQRVKAHLGWA